MIRRRSLADHLMRSFDHSLSRRNFMIVGSSLLSAFAAGRATFAATSSPDWPVGSNAAAIAESAMRPAIKASGIPGAAFVCFDAAGHLAARYFGLSDREAGAAVTAETVWPIASVTKVLTAIAALTLIDRGRLDLDSDIRSYLRSVRVPDHDGPQLTLRRLLCHTGGFDEVPGRMWDAHNTMPRVSDFLAKDKLRRVRPAGQLTAYSSYGMALVSVLIEDASRSAYEAYVRDALFEPLAMRSARFMRTANDASGVARGYAIDDGKATRVDHEFYVTTGAASAVCTIGDMARLGTMVLKHGAVGAGRVLSSALAKEMLRQQASVHPLVPGWGLGVQLDAVGNTMIAEHGGDIAGFSCLLTLLPDIGIGFFTVHHGEGGDLRFRVRDAVIAAIAPFTPEKPTPDPAAARALASYVGRYRSTLECFTCAGDPGENAFVCKLGPNGNTLELWGQTWVPVGGDLFVREDGAKKLGFARNRDGRVTAVSGGAWRVGVKID